MKSLLLKNKAAMFGLESRAFKKQFGKLFLVRMQSVDSQETRGASIQPNRAAMFGLDARIALAIFGALSVISGAALYSAIKEASTVRFITQMDEWAKASDAYYLDVRKNLPQYDTSRPQAMDLINNRENLSRWKGPYITGMTPTNTVGADLERGLWFTIFYFTLSDWPSNSANPCAVNNTDCAEWIHLYADTASEVAFLEPIGLEMDKKIDSEDGGEKGKVRFRYDTNKFYLFYQGRQVKKTS